MEIKFPKIVNSTQPSINWFLSFINQLLSLKSQKIILNFKDTTWFDANLTAVLGAVLQYVEYHINHIEIINLNNELKDLFERNHFLSNFGGIKIPDESYSTIKYRKFKTTEESNFKQYLDNELLSNKGFPNISFMLRKKIKESIFEIFNNAVLHGECIYIFSCGQLFPKIGKLVFTIVNLGNTIKYNVNKFLNQHLSGSEAISWALLEGNTTKTENIPGGLGLSLIEEFLLKNEGKFEIISAEGYWSQEKEKFERSFLPGFPGTIVNLEFNIKDIYTYYLTSEIHSKDIF